VSCDRNKIMLMKLILFFISCQSVIAMAFDDPTRPPSFRAISSETEKKTSGSFVLSSILISPQRSVAIINGRTVQLGDWLGNFQVHSIDKTSVTLTEDREHITLKLLPSSIKSVHEKN